MQRSSGKNARASRAMFATLAAMLLSPATALAGTFAVMTYNVRGLPPEVIEDRHAQITAIAPRLEDFHTPATPYVGIPSFVALEEVFYQDYYDILTDPQTVSYAFITAKDDGGPTGIGDGLDNLSDFAIGDFERTQWNDCYGTFDSGSDCGTDKGFSYSKVTLEAGVTIDVYTLHADAGQDSGSQSARRKNITQLVDAINQRSPLGTAVLVLGDTNSLYTRVGSDNIQDLLTGTGVTDVWVQLERGGVVPDAGPEIDSECSTDPGGSGCEVVDKIFYRDGNTLSLAPVIDSYAALKAMFSDEQGNELSDHTPITVRFDYAVVTPVTTTTTSSSSSSTSTSTTTSLARPCGDPVALVAKRADRMVAGGLRAVVASDALFVLKAAVGARTCPLCTCDVDSSGVITASDALRVLKKAVGENVTLTCVPCM